MSDYKITFSSNTNGAPDHHRPLVLDCWKACVSKPFAHPAVDSLPHVLFFDWKWRFVRKNDVWPLSLGVSSVACSIIKPCPLVPINEPAFLCRSQTQKSYTLRREIDFSLISLFHSRAVLATVLNRSLRWFITILLSSAALVTRGLPDLGKSLTVPVIWTRLFSLCIVARWKLKWRATSFTDITLSIPTASCRWEFVRRGMWDLGKLYSMLLFWKQYRNISGSTSR